MAEYRLIWNNRLLVMDEKNSKDTLWEAIIRELLDENSHPRIRKNRFEKYYSAVKRITNSSISLDAKLQLIELHNEIMDQLCEERES